MTGLRAAVNGMFDEPRSLRALALLRILVGPIVLIHLAPFVADMMHGHYYADFYFSPWNDWIPHVSRPLYFGMLLACLVTALLMSAGVFTRWTTFYTFSFVAYNVFVNQLHYKHNRCFLVLILAVLLLVPVGRALSVDALRRRPGTDSEGPKAPLWPMYLLRFEVISVYTASAFSKLINPDWWSGTVTWDRVLRFRHQVVEAGVPNWAVELVSDPRFHQVFAKVAIFSELLIAAGLLYRRTRYAAIWFAISFHAVIGMTLKVQVFSYLAIAATLIWVTPKTRDRIVRITGNGRVERWARFAVRNLDWLARFEVVEEHEPRGVSLRDRDGREYSGREAVLRILRLCPALFFFVAPLLLPGIRRLTIRP